jgi:hypothetical protein
MGMLDVLAVAPQMAELSAIQVVVEGNSSGSVNS